MMMYIQAAGYVVDAVCSGSPRFLSAMYELQVGIMSVIIDTNWHSYKGPRAKSWENTDMANTKAVGKPWKSLHPSVKTTRARWKVVKIMVYLGYPRCHGQH